MTTERPDDFLDIIDGEFIGRSDIINRWGSVISSFQNIPGLVGLWPMSSVQRSTGNAYDLSGQGRTLTYNGNPTYNIDGFAPYIDLDGTGDFLSRADETDLDVQGNEAIFNSNIRGLTVGGWFKQNTQPGVAGLITKDNAAAQRSFALRINVDSPRMEKDGQVAETAISSLTVSTGIWYFYAGRFMPSTEVAIFVNDIKDTDTTGIGATITNSTAALSVGSFDSSFLFNGNASLCFMSANAVPDSIINALFQQSRVLFGV